MRLVLLRHAKSDWHSGAATDHERRLNGRGKREALRVGQRLARAGWIPDRVISSDASRATETWARMAPAFGRPIELVTTRRLYDAGLAAIAEVLGDLPSEVWTVLVIGHNPGWEQAASDLSGVPVALTTANAVLLTRDDVPWREALRPGAWKLVSVVRPKELGETDPASG
jgi:phosphohistidine phosphatase